MFVSLSVELGTELMEKVESAEEYLMKEICECHANNMCPNPHYNSIFLPFQASGCYAIYFRLFPISSVLGDNELKYGSRESIPQLSGKLILAIKRGRVVGITYSIVKQASRRKHTHWLFTPPVLRSVSMKIQMKI